MAKVIISVEVETDCGMCINNTDDHYHTMVRALKGEKDLQVNTAEIKVVTSGPCDCGRLGR